MNMFCRRAGIQIPTALDVLGGCQASDRRACSVHILALSILGSCLLHGDGLIAHCANPLEARLGARISLLRSRTVWRRTRRRRGRWRRRVVGRGCSWCERHLLHLMQQLLGMLGVCRHVVCLRRGGQVGHRRLRQEGWVRVGRRWFHLDQDGLGLELLGVNFPLLGSPAMLNRLMRGQRLLLVLYLTVLLVGRLPLLRGQGSRRLRLLGLRSAERLLLRVLRLNSLKCRRILRHTDCRGYRMLVVFLRWWFGVLSRAPRLSLALPRRKPLGLHDLPLLLPVGGWCWNHSPGHTMGTPLSWEHCSSSLQILRLVRRGLCLLVVTVVVLGVGLLIHGRLGQKNATGPLRRRVSNPWISRVLRTVVKVAKALRSQFLFLLRPEERSHLLWLPQDVASGRRPWSTKPSSCMWRRILRVLLFIQQRRCCQ